MALGSSIPSASCVPAPHAAPRAPTAIAEGHHGDGAAARRGQQEHGAAWHRGASPLPRDPEQSAGDLITENLSQQRKAEISSVTRHPIHSSGFSNLFHLIFRRGRLEQKLAFIQGGGKKEKKKKVDQHKSSCPLPQVRGVERSSPRSTPPPPRWAASGVINPFVSAQPRRWLSSSGQRFTCGNITSIPQPNHMHKGKQSCIKHGIYCLLASLPNLKSPLTGPNNCTFRIKEERRGRRKKKLRARTSCGLGINSSRNVHWY